MSSMRRAFSALTLTAVIGSVLSCASVAQITNGDDANCRGAFSQAIGSILVAQGETRETADRLAIQTLDQFGPAGLGGYFVIESASGTEYSFFVQKKDAACLLRLYGRQRAHSSYTNNLTYIETRELPSCSCSN